MLQRRPSRRMLHDVIVLVHFFLKAIKIIVKHVFIYLFPWKGTLTDAGDGEGGQQSQNYPPNITKSNKKQCQK